MAYNCITLPKVSHKKLFLFFPKNECSKKVWIATINRKKGTLTRNTYLCSNHFKEACFNKSWALQTVILHIKSQEKKTYEGVDCCNS